MRIRAALLILTLVLAGTVAGERPVAGALPRAYNGLAATPPMGWNDYNAYGLEVTEALIERTADAMVANGMRDAGYAYVTIDDGWMAAGRDAAGNLRPDPARFPHGIAAVAGYVHARGLKLGLYADAGLRTCGGLAGSLGHERADAALFAAWGVDYLKYDNCYAGPGCDQVDCPGGRAAPARERYAAMRDALLATGRPIVFSLCAWGTEDVARWGAGYGNLWRTTGDISPTYASMLSIFRQTVGLDSRAGPGGWNDPDMLQVGNGMTAVEDRAELTLWAALGAPLIAGTDLVRAGPDTLALLTNRAVIAVDQDPLGRVAREVSAAGGRHVLARPLSGGDVAVVLFNETGTTATIGTTAEAVGASPGPHRLTDLWAGTSTTTGGDIEATVPPHGALLYRVAA
ncbi:glycoside hydrolase family 27 protein [Actinoplanes sp. NPDC049265]|uniref:glycoside hydrolase family 27 protein n=1 Tax=Actinoplanes sp. NPDC049265 TaxID=3363902 RepID=UPI00371F3F7B